MKQVFYRARPEEALVLGDGTRFGHDDSGEGFIASSSDASEIGLTPLRKALGRFAAEYGLSRSRLVVVDMPRSRLDDDVLFDPIELVWEQGEMRVSKDFALADEPPSTDQLIARIRPLLSPRRTVAAIDRYQDRDSWILTVEISVNTHGQTVGSAIGFARDVETLMLASVDEIAGVVSLVRAGQAHLLIGCYESDWLEVKSAPYRDVPAEELELAKDVAAFANGSGGVLLIGLKTKRDRQGDRINAVNECVLNSAITRRYRGVIKKHVYPMVEKLAIDAVPGSDTEHGVILFEVPDQPQGSKPFIVHGIVQEGRVEGAYFAVPVRGGADTDFLDIRVLHSRLRAGTSFLAGAGAPRRAEESERARDVEAADVEARLERLLDATVPDFLRDVVSSAQRSGFTVERARDSIAFTSRGGEVIVAPSSSSGALADRAARQTLVERLGALGLPVRQTARGLLVPGD
jgi:hypothetical protein